MNTGWHVHWKKPRLEEYDYLIVNDVLEEAVREVHEIIQNEHYRVARNADKIREMRNELKGFTRQ